MVRTLANMLDNIFLAAFFSVQYFVPITLYQSGNNIRVYAGGRLVTVSGCDLGGVGFERSSVTRRLLPLWISSFTCFVTLCC